MKMITRMSRIPAERRQGNTRKTMKQESWTSRGQSLPILLLLCPFIGIEAYHDCTANTYILPASPRRYYCAFVVQSSTDKPRMRTRTMFDNVQRHSCCRYYNNVRCTATHSLVVSSMSSLSHSNIEQERVKSSETTTMMKKNSQEVLINCESNNSKGMMMHRSHQQAEKNKELFQNDDTRKLLGLPDGTFVKNKWLLRLQLLKPISWIPLSLMVMCGAAASGNFHWNEWDDILKSITTMILAGPFSEGFAQTINDWYDKDIDAINEPYRPIPSGQITPKEVMEQLMFLFVGGLLLAFGLDVWSNHQTYVVTSIALFGYIMSYIYSAPPLKLKQNGWLGDLAIGLCYISLPWFCGQTVFGTIEQPIDWILPCFFSLTAMSAGIVNDFKSMEGDQQFGLQSIPLMIGIENAKWLACLIPDIVQLLVAYYFFSINEPIVATLIATFIVPQMYLQTTLLLKDPIQNDIKFVAFSQPLIVLNLFIASLCIGKHTF